MVNARKKPQKLMVAAVLYVLSVFSVSAVLNSALHFIFFSLVFFPPSFYSHVEVVAWVAVGC